MPYSLPEVSEVVIICTRNRPAELEQTLTSIAAHPPSVDLGLAVMDASDEAQRTRTRSLVEGFETLPSVHWSYPDTPSLARQRNAAIDCLPSSIEIVHFIDDDVTVEPGYFEALSETLRSEPDVGGAGGVVSEPTHASLSPLAERLRYLFFLGHPDAGRVLPSGYATDAQFPRPGKTSAPRKTEWLSGCSSSYRRALLDQHCFDEALTGYSMLEDLDFSYRLHQQARLLVQPEARLTHRRASRNRLDAERYSRALTVHRRWFIEKHFDTPKARIAYWWSVVGRLFSILASSSPNRDVALRGLIHGIYTVLIRDHPLLSS